MSSNASSIHFHLPPTTNLLDSQQRTRLLRSTRKLGAVLGTTSYLLEQDVSFTFLPFGMATSKALKRQGSVFIPSSSSMTSISTTSSHSSSASMDVPKESRPPGLSSTQRRRPPHLCLQANTTRVPVSLDNDTFSFLSLSPSPLPSPCPTPVTPVTPVPDPAATRRKRVAKLARHFGEQIPAELVLTSESAPTQSVHATHNERLRVRDDRPPVPQPMPRQEWVGEWNRTDIRDVQKELRNLRAR